jgi:hypothetical protein
MASAVFVVLYSDLGSMTMMKNPPVPLPENLWGDQWRFATLPAVELADAFKGRLVPIVEMPEARLPLNLGLASDLPIPGIVIDGGRQAMKLALWLQQAQPATMSCVTGPPDGLVLAAGERDRWIVATFDDPEVHIAGQEFERRKQASRGLHFLLVQPDNSGMTHSGFWLLREE